MKKIFSVLASALLLVGCVGTGSYDDSFVLEKLANLEKRVTEIESSVKSIQSTLGDGRFVKKVQELTDETGRTVGVTVTYTDGEVVNFTISKVTDPDAAPVLSVMMNGAGELCWAIDGKILQKDGKDVLVYVTPIFTIGSDGHLYVTVDGEDIDLGNVKGDKGDKGEQGDKGPQGEPGANGADGKDGKDGKDGSVPVVQDGVIKAIQVTETSVILTYDNGTVELPLAKAFSLNIEKTEYVVKSTDPIEIPYTVTNATANTIVDVFYGSEIKAVVKDSKIIATPKSASAEGLVLAYADSRNGLASIVKLSFEGEVFDITDKPAAEGIDYIVDSDGGTLVVNVVSNVDFEVKPVDSWIKFVSTKAMDYKVTLDVAENPEANVRTGSVNVVRAGTDELLQTVTIAQKAKDAVTNLSKKASANCYVVTAAGKYKFAAVKGNSSETVGEVASAEVLWETYNNADEVIANSVVASVGYADGFITFEMPQTIHPGNAVIAAKNAAGEIIWSWHIWVPSTDIATSTYGIHEKEIMDRNLGALVAATADASPVDVLSYGLMYQWGRKDPYVAGGTLTGSSNATVAGVKLSKAAATITLEESIKNPTLMGHTDNGDWLSTPDNTLWTDGAKTIYDPCPAGYRVPARDKTQPFFSADLKTVTGWAADAANYWVKMGEPSCVFPLAGYRDDYSVESIAKGGKRVVIWSAHNDGDLKAYMLNIRGDSGTFALGSAPKSRGGSVRCIAE